MHNDKQQSAVVALRKAKGWVRHSAGCAINDPGNYTGGCNCGAKQKWDEIDAALANLAPDPVDAIYQLTHHQQQADMDGVMVTVSRQALDEVLTYLAALTIKDTDHD